MPRLFAKLCCALVVGAMSCGAAHAVGEDILAHSGQYTFFVKPNPCAPVTYHQKTVPCMVTRDVPTVRMRQVTYHLPVPLIVGRRVMIRETPIACPADRDPCVRCLPKVSTHPGVGTTVEPRPARVQFTDPVVVPQCVTRRVNLPRWFMVEEIPAGRFRSGAGASPAACANAF
jgi:hypothetical protein